MADDLTTLLGYLRQDLATFRAEVNARFDRLVTQDAFAAEQRRRDEVHAELGKDVAENKAAAEAALRAERQARKAEIDEERRARLAAQASTDARSRKAWTAVRWTITTVIALSATVAAIWALFVR